MKFNLKTWKLHMQEPFDVPIDDCETCERKITEWFEGFEKELREYIRFIDNARSHGKSEQMKIKYKIYKEILGETP